MDVILCVIAIMVWRENVVLMQLDMKELDVHLLMLLYRSLLP